MPIHPFINSFMPSPKAFPLSYPDGPILINKTAP